MYRDGGRGMGEPEIQEKVISATCVNGEKNRAETYGIRNRRCKEKWFLLSPLPSDPATD